VQVFNELLVQYPLPRRKRPGQVVPDNMVVVHPEPIKANWSFDLPLQPTSPFWVLDYISQWNKRKDYTENRNKYEQNLKVLYYLMFASDSQEMTLYRHDGEKYVSVKPNARGRCEIPELELEVGLHDGWMRFWLRGEMLLLPAELQAQIQRERRELQKMREARLAAEQENARLRAELEQLRRGAGG
jgi:hypothetical protein